MHFLAYVRYGLRGGGKALADMSAKNAIFILDGSPKGKGGKRVNDKKTFFLY